MSLQDHLKSECVQGRRFRVGASTVNSLSRQARDQNERCCARGYSTAVPASSGARCIDRGGFSGSEDFKFSCNLQVAVGSEEIS